LVVSLSADRHHLAQRSLPRRPRRPVALAFLLFVLGAGAAVAQELEPRAYSNLPVGLNFAAVVYAYSEGGLATDPSLPIDDAHLEIHTTAFAYVRSLAIGPMSGKVDMIVPYSSLEGTGLVAGEPASRDVDGFHDPRLRFALNFHGAPALGLREFMQNAAARKSDFVVGASLGVQAPLGQYDPSKLINLGTNRWQVRPDIGFSKRLAQFTLDMGAGVAFFTENDNFFGGKTVEQDPIWSIQSNLSYDFGKGIWAAVGFTYYSGGRTTVDGVQKNNELANSRAGLTVSFPINRNYSVKFNFSGGVSTRTGTSFTTTGVGLLYRWGGGL
jgi:hypothetical protein